MATLAPEGEFRIVSLNVSETKGTRKKPILRVLFEVGKGIEGDAHSGLLEDRQVSLLAMEEIVGASAICAKMTMGATGLVPGDFAENVTTEGIALHELPLGTRLHIGTAELEVSKIGKECHGPCEIRRLVGSCVMPTRGIFARVLRTGEASVADRCRYRIG